MKWRYGNANFKVWKTMQDKLKVHANQACKPVKCKPVKCSQCAVLTQQVQDTEQRNMSWREMHSVKSFFDSQLDEK